MSSMTQQDLIDELVLLESSAPPGDFRFSHALMSAAERAHWQDVLATGGGSTTSHGGGVDDESREGEALLSSPPSIELALTSYATLSVSWTTTTRAAVAANRPSSDSTSSSSLGGGNGGGGGGLEQAFDVSAKELAREDHARLRHEMLAQLEQLRNDDTPFLAFALANALRDWLAEAGIEPRASDEQAHGRQGAHGQHQQRVRGPLHLKLALLWSHHLLATSKRRDIVAWASELDLYVISKPGYPGVIVTEGIERDVDEFLTRIKALQWKALQVRSEECGPPIECPSNVADERSYALGQCKLASVVVPAADGGCDSTHKAGDRHRTGAREVEDMSSAADLMRRAGLEDVFLTALKITKSHA